MLSRIVSRRFWKYSEGLINKSFVHSSCNSSVIINPFLLNEKKALFLKCVKNFSTQETRLTWDPTKPTVDDNIDDDINDAFEPEFSTEFSRTAEDISALLQSMEVVPGRNFVVDDSAIVDIGIFIDGYQIAVEIERSSKELGKNLSDASSGSSGADTCTRDLKRRFLQQRGWHVAYIDDFQWSSLTTYEAKKKLLMDSISIALGGLTLKHGACGGSCGDCGCNDKKNE
mmetsp:Transcript_13012/g.23143  ORF Transcript_13012/g.23143 Transcript_13012/m.23143 type:complete len:228 (-) Transcript_13012:252-935(-)